eukprot:XP_001700689.1 predicted protein [Chlamydomonas reinhardtii]
MHVVRQLGLAPSPFCGSRPSFSTKAVKADAPSDQLDTAMLRMISELSGRVDEAVAVTVTKNNEAARQIAFASDSELRKRVVASIQKLSKGLLERDVEVRLLLLAALCCEHLLLLGPPGTAKSELSRRLSSLCGGTYFERLLTRFSVPEELFGPLSMKGLENDLYVRQTDGYLPTSEVAFVDEIFKLHVPSPSPTPTHPRTRIPATHAQPVGAILNALLTLLNERLFDNGNQRLEAPLLCLVGASNEMPESEELDALYDRFLIRRTVSQVSNTQLYKLARLAAGRTDHSLTGVAVANANGNGNGNGAAEAVPHEVLRMDDFRHTAGAAYGAVDVPDAVIDLLTSLRCHLQDKCEPPMYVSDRRFMKSVQMLQAELVLLGLFGRTCRLLDGASRRGGGAGQAARRGGRLGAGLFCHSQWGENDDGFPELRASLWQAESSVAAAVQALSPQMTENRKKVEELLREAHTLSAVLATPGATAPLLERLLPKRFKQYAKGISAKA